MIIIIYICFIIFNKTVEIKRNIKFVPSVITTGDISLSPYLNSITYFLPSIEIQAGDSDQLYSLILDTERIDSYIGNNSFFNKRIPSTNLEKSEYLISRDSIVEGPVFKGKFNLIGLNGSSEFSFGVMNEFILNDNFPETFRENNIVLGYDGKLGLFRSYEFYYGLSCHYNSYIHNLQYNKIISKKIFSIELNEQYRNNFFYLNNSANLNETNSYTCLSTSNDNPFWYCNVKGFIVCNKASKSQIIQTNHRNQIALVTTTFPFISAPYDEAKVIIDKIILILTDKGNKCELIENRRGDFKFLKCDNNKGINSFSFSFIIDSNSILNVTEKELFYIGKDKLTRKTFYICKFILTNNIYLWRMGTPLLMNKRVTFDMEQYKIYFEEINTKDNYVLKVIYIEISLMLIVGIVIFILSKGGFK